MACLSESLKDDGLRWETWRIVPATPYQARIGRLRVGAVNAAWLV